MSNFFLQDSLKNFADYLKMQGRSSSTIESYTRDARRFCSFLEFSHIDLQSLEPKNLIEFQNFLREEFEEKTNTIRRSVIAIRVFFRFLVTQKSILSSPFEYVPIPERFENEASTLDSHDVQKLINACQSYDNSLICLRDELIIRLLSEYGLKASELIELTWTRLHFIDQKIETSLAGVKSRDITLVGEIAQVFFKYRTAFLSDIRLSHFNHVFPAFKGKDLSVVMDHMTRHGLKFIINELGVRVLKKNLSCEMLRQYTIESLLLQGKSVEEIMAFLGLTRMGVIAKHIQKLKDLGQVYDPSQRKITSSSLSPTP